MITVEETLIDEITATIYHLRTGKIPPPIPIPDDLPDNEIRQLIIFVNRLLSEFAPFAEAMEQVAQGELDTRNLLGRMSVVQSFKALRSNLRHLTSFIPFARGSGQERVLAMALAGNLP